MEAWCNEARGIGSRKRGKVLDFIEKKWYFLIWW
jgi:hypothetical protein